MKYKVILTVFMLFVMLDILNDKAKEAFDHEPVTTQLMEFSAPQEEITSNEQWLDSIKESGIFKIIDKFGLF
jgi:hypothetical protein